MCVTKFISMKPLQLFSLLISACLLVSSCDFIRSLAGKPTSTDIELLKLEKEMAFQKKKAVQDSINAAQAEAERLLSEQQQNSTFSSQYYLALGGFKVTENAIKYKEQLEKEGYSIILIRFKNGYDMLLGGGADTYKEAQAQLNDFIENAKNCPYDIWIYDTSTNLHE